MTRRQRILQNELCEQLIVEKEGPSGWITFNDPDRHNAISYAMWDGIPLALTTFQDDPEIKSVVLTGAGEKAFVSGANISQFDTLRTGSDAVEQYEIVAERAQLALRDFPKPLLARINGYCIGAGSILPYVATCASPATAPRSPFRRASWAWATASVRSRILCVPRALPMRSKYS